LCAEKGGRKRKERVKGRGERDRSGFPSVRTIPPLTSEKKRRKKKGKRKQERDGNRAVESKA